MAGPWGGMVSSPSRRRLRHWPLPLLLLQLVLLVVVGLLLLSPTLHGRWHRMLPRCQQLSCLRPPYPESRPASRHRE